MLTGRMLVPAAAGFAAVLIWGGTPAATAVAARDMAPALVGMARILLASLLLIAVIVVLRPKLPSGGSGWTILAISGLIGFAASFVLQSIGIAKTATSHAALLFAAAPVLTGFLQFLLDRSWPGGLWWAGGAVALAGEAVLIFGRSAANGPSAASVTGDLIVAASVVCLSIGYVAGARLARQIGLLAATIWSILSAGLCFLPALPFLVPDLSAMTAIGASSLFYLVVFCTILGYAAWFYALDRGGAARIAPIQFGQPFVSLVIAVVLLSEPLSLTVWIAVFLILCGVWLCRRNQEGRAGRQGKAD